MLKSEKPAQEDIDKLYKKLHDDAIAGGYNLNDDVVFTKELVEGLIVNQNRYGYMACPCRLASGLKDTDKDIVCPCDYRDPDLNDFDACFCGLYVSTDILNKIKKLKPIPDRRNELSDYSKDKSSNNFNAISSLKFPVWRCKVCGYLCARDNPPAVCPICKVTKDRFEKFI